MSLAKLNVKKGDTVLVLSGKDKLVCPACGKATRIAHRFVNGRKIRACKKCGEAIEQ